MMRVAIVHYWLINMRGGEKVLEAFCEMFPKADIYTHVYKHEGMSDTIKRHRIKTTFINRLPFAEYWYKNYLPLMPLAIEQLDLREYDLVISSESGPAKGFVTSSGTVHVCYCHTPMRYLWDMYHDYLSNAGIVKRMMIRPLMHYLRMWDALSALRVDHFIANSNFVAQRIRKHYRRDSNIVHPPVSAEDFYISEEISDYYLMVGQLVSYKCAHIAIDAFNRLGKKLIIIGDGEEYKNLKRRAGPNIHLMGRQSFSVIRKHYAECRALIFPGVEDFGIVPLEAMSSGRPVIAYRAGGALETVVEGKTGLFFNEQTVDALIESVEEYEETSEQYKPSLIREHAEKFNNARFKHEMRSLIDKFMDDHLHGR